jgi:hypothetical protein
LEISALRLEGNARSKLRGPKDASEGVQSRLDSVQIKKIKDD